MIDNAITSQKLNIPHRFVDAAVQAESGWQANPSVGAAGEVGNMQIMKGTAEQPGIPGVNPIPQTALAGPQNTQANINFGANMLDKVGKQYGLNTADDWENNPDKVAQVYARYNGGNANDPMSSKYVQQMGYRLARPASYESSATQEASAASTNGAPPTANDASGSNTSLPSGVAPGSPAASVSNTTLSSLPNAVSSTQSPASPVANVTTTQAAKWLAQFRAGNLPHPNGQQALAMANIAAPLVATGRMPQTYYDHLTSLAMDPLTGAAKQDAETPGAVSRAYQMVRPDAQKAGAISQATLPAEIAKQDNQRDNAIAQNVQENIQKLRETVMANYYGNHEYRAGGGVFNPGAPSSITGLGYDLPSLNVSGNDIKSTQNAKGEQGFVDVPRLPNIQTGASPVPGGSGIAPPQPQQQSQTQPAIPQQANTAAPPAPTPVATPPNVPQGAAPSGGRLQYRANTGLGNPTSQFASASPQLPAPSPTPAPIQHVPTQIPQAQPSAMPTTDPNEAKPITLNGQPIIEKQGPVVQGALDAQKEAEIKVPPKLSALSAAAVENNSQLQQYANLLDQSTPGAGAQYIAHIKNIVGSMATRAGIPADQMNIDSGNVAAMQGLVSQAVRSDLAAFHGRSNTEYHATEKSITASPDNTRYGNKISLAQMQGMNDYDVAMNDAFLRSKTNGGFMPDGKTPTNAMSFENDFQNTYSPLAFIGNRMGQTPEGTTYLRNLAKNVPQTEAAKLANDIQTIHQHFGTTAGIPNSLPSIPRMSNGYPILSPNANQPLN